MHEKYENEVLETAEHKTLHCDTISGQQHNENSEALNIDNIMFVKDFENLLVTVDCKVHDDEEYIVKDKNMFQDEANIFQLLRKETKQDFAAPKGLHHSR